MTMYGVFYDYAIEAGVATHVLVGLFPDKRLAEIALGRRILARTWAQWAPRRRSRSVTRRYVLLNARRSVHDYAIVELPSSGFLPADHPILQGDN